MHHLDDKLAWYTWFQGFGRSMYFQVIVLKLAQVRMNNRNYIWNWLELQWWAYGSNQNQYLDTEELSSTRVSLLIPDLDEQGIRMKKIKRKVWSQRR